MTDNPSAATTLNKNDLIVVTGAGGFIAGALVEYFHNQGFTHIRGYRKPVIRLELS
jgi:nucleoside-diphosphate-sugar epimerase